MEGLPLKVRADIRDKFDSATSTVAKAIQTVQATLGYHIKPHVEWTQLWDAMSEVYKDDKAAFVPWVEARVEAWYDRFNIRLENEQEEEWTNKVLEELEGAQSAITLRVEPASKGVTTLDTTWLSNSSTFVFTIPTSSKFLHVAELSSSLDHPFASFSLDPAPTSPAVQDEDWADVTTGQDVPSSSPSSVPIVPSLIPVRLPPLHALPAPRQLLSALKMHTLVVEYRRSHITISSTHQQSLELLKSYLAKYARADVDRRKLLIELQESDYGAGLIDGLTIGPWYSNRAFELNPLMIIAVVEAIGYTLKPGNGEAAEFKTWVYHASFI